MTVLVSLDPLVSFCCSITVSSFMSVFPEVFSVNIKYMLVCNFYTCRPTHCILCFSLYILEIVLKEL